MTEVEQKKSKKDLKINIDDPEKQSKHGKSEAKMNQI